MTEEENPNNSTPKPDDFLTKYAPKQNKPGDGMKIVGYNLLALALYSLVCLSLSGGFVLDAFILFFHVLLCLGLAIDKRSRLWLLSGLLVLIIGFSTCVTFAGMK
jgi:asparagine N-glycosylation enzyme membrane subunit Stt3